MDLSKATFRGYKRENGRVGVRNHVLVLPVDDLSNAACEAVANNIKGTLAIPHPYGRLQFGADLELHFKTLIGTASNPNVAAAVVIGIEDGWAKRVADGIAATGKPVSFFGIEGHGDMETIRRASKAAKDYMHWASELRREERPLKDLWVSTKCGESDTTSGIGANPCVGNAFDKLYAHGVTLVFGETTELTGGEQLVAARCRTPEVRDKFMFMFNRYQEVIDRHKTSDLMDSQPTKGNIAGGLTTIEEKALGNIQKIGKKCMVDERVKLGSSELLLNGAGIRTRLFFKVYVGALYLPERKSSATEVLALRGAKRVSMALLRDLTARQLTDALEEGIRANSSEAELAVLKERIDALVATMNEIGSAKEKTVITLDFLPESGTRVTVDGEARGKPIPGEDFFVALLRIWLGEKPVDADLKKAMLGEGR